MSKNGLFAKTILLILVMIMTGCVSLPQSEPYYVSNDFNPDKKQRIALLGAVNLGMNEELDTELDKPGLIEDVLTDRGYTFVNRVVYKAPEEVNKETFDNKNFEWVKKVGLPPDTWALLVAVDYLNRTPYGLGGSRGDAYVTGYLVELPSGRLLWEGFGSGHLGLGFLMKAIVDDDALNMATAELMKSFPPADNKLAGAEPGIVKIIGECVDGSCANSSMDPEICVLRNKNTAYLDEEDDGVEKDSFDAWNIQRPLSDGATVIVKNLEAGQHKCFSKKPGKTFIHLEEGKPAFFRAKAGHKYYLNAEFGRTWEYKEVPSNEWEQLRLTKN